MRLRAGRLEWRELGWVKSSSARMQERCWSPTEGLIQRVGDWETVRIVLQVCGFFDCQDHECLKSYVGMHLRQGKHRPNIRPRHQGEENVERQVGKRQPSPWRRFVFRLKFRVRRGPNSNIGCLLLSFPINILRQAFARERYWQAEAPDPLGNLVDKREVNNFLTTSY